MNEEEAREERKWSYERERERESSSALVAGTKRGSALIGACETSKTSLTGTGQGSRGGQSSEWGRGEEGQRVGQMSRGRGPHLEWRECGDEPIGERGFGVASLT